MSTRTHYESNPDYAGDTLYAKPKEPTVRSPWDGDIIEMSGDNTADGDFEFVVDNDTNYTIRLQEGDDPAGTDSVVGSISALLNVSSTDDSVDMHGIPNFLIHALRRAIIEN